MMICVGFADADTDGKLQLPPLETVLDLGAYGSASSLNSNNDLSLPAVTALEDPRLLHLQALEGFIAPLTFEVAELASVDEVDSPCCLDSCSQYYNYGHISIQYTAPQPCGYCAWRHEPKDCPTKDTAGYT
jgi:hypothetical protein